mgnify:CR=1 FL=1
MAKVSVIGAGSWGTALAMLLCGSGHDTVLWSHREEQAEELRRTREHKAKLPGVRLPEGITITSSLEEALEGKDVIVLAVPSVAVRSTARKMNPYIRYGQLIVNVAKGIEEHTLTTLTDMIEEEIPNSQAFSRDQAMRKKSAGICLPPVWWGQKEKKPRNICRIFL